MRYFKVGGLRFFRVWRIQLSFCLCRTEKPRRKAPRTYSGGRVIDLMPCEYSHTTG